MTAINLMHDCWEWVPPVAARSDVPSVPVQLSPMEKSHFTSLLAVSTERSQLLSLRSRKTSISFLTWTSVFFSFDSILTRPNNHQPCFLATEKHCCPLTGKILLGSGKPEGQLQSICGTTYTHVDPVWTCLSLRCIRKCLIPPPRCIYCAWMMVSPTLSFSPVSVAMVMSHWRLFVLYQPTNTDLLAMW